jgi:hypothetical protein
VKFIDDSFFGYNMGPWWSLTTPAPKRILATIGQKKNRHLQAATPVTPATPAVTPVTPATPAVTPVTPATPAVTPVTPATPAVNDQKASIDFKTFKLKKYEGKTKWDIYRTQYTKKALTTPVEIHFSYVGTSVLKAVKNKMSKIDIWYMGQMLN